MRRKAADIFQVVVGEEHMHSLECQCSLVPLLWAAENGESTVVDLLLVIGNIDANLKDSDSQTPLLCPAGNGHEAVVKLLKPMQALVQFWQSIMLRSVGDGQL
jgi:hypothetical protein